MRIIELCETNRNNSSSISDAASVPTSPTTNAKLNKIILLALTGIIFFTGHASAEGRGQTVEIRARKFSYTPHIIRVKTGDKVKIRLISEDVTHGIFIDGYGVETRAYPGQDGSLSFAADRPGRFAFRCSVTCGEFHPYMIGYLVVGPNLRFYLYALAALFIGAITLAVIFGKAAKASQKRPE